MWDEHINIARAITYKQSQAFVHTTHLHCAVEFWSLYVDLICWAHCTTCMSIQCLLATTVMTNKTETTPQRHTSCHSYIKICKQPQYDYLGWYCIDTSCKNSACLSCASASRSNRTTATYQQAGASWYVCWALHIACPWFQQPAQNTSCWLAAQNANNNLMWAYKAAYMKQ